MATSFLKKLKTNIYILIGVLGIIISLWTLFQFSTRPLEGQLEIVYQCTLLMMVGCLGFQLFFGENNETILAFLFLIGFLWELFFFELEMNAFRIGYSTQLIVAGYFLFSNIPKLKIKIERLFSKDIFVIISFALLYFLIVWLSNGFSSPYPKNALGEEISTWFLSGWDQSCYYKMTEQIASGQWFPKGYSSGYRYGLGYPLLASLFYPIYNSNPFLILNLIFFIAIALLFKKTTEPYFSSIAVFAITFLLLTQTPISNLSKRFMLTGIVPWTNIIAVFVSSFFLYLLFGLKELNKYIYLFGGIAYGLLFASRYGDILYFLPLAIGLISRDVKSNVNFYNNLKQVFINGLIFSLGALLLMIPTLVSHKVFYGDYWTTYLHYAINGPKTTFFPALFDVKVHLYKFLELFIYPYLGTTRSVYRISGILASMPFVLLFLLGIYKFYKRQPLSTLLCLLFVSANFVFFTATGATSAKHIKYQCLRYFAPMIPFLFFFSFWGWNSIRNLNIKRVRILQLFGVLSVGIILFCFISDKSVHLIRQSIEPSPALTVTFLGKADGATQESTPNLRPDGKLDLQFNLNIECSHPIYISRARAIVLDGKGETWITSRRKRNDKKLWGIGLRNAYGKELNYQYTGDNYAYGNYYLPDNKELVAYLPLPYEINGRIKFVIETSLGRIEDIVEVSPNYKSQKFPFEE